MNSVEALDFALRILRNRQRRLRLESAEGPSAEAIETLSTLRDLIADSYPDTARIPE